MDWTEPELITMAFATWMVADHSYPGGKPEVEFKRWHLLGDLAVGQHQCCFSLAYIQQSIILRVE